MEWQPIDSAPKGGTRVLLFRKDYAEDIAVCYFSEDWQAWKVVFGNFFANPTHWMPLPKAPKD